MQAASPPTKPDGGLKDEAASPESNLVDVSNKKAIIDIFKMSAFPSIGALFNPAHAIMNTITLGHSDSPNELAGYGLGNMIIVMVMAIGGITAQASGTFISQAYGSGDRRHCAIYCNRQIFINSVLYCIMAIPLLFVRQIYDLMGQDPEVSDLAAKYVNIMSPVVLSFFMQ